MARIVPYWAAALRPPSPGRCSVPRRLRGEPAAGAGGLPGAVHPECQQRARPREAFHPDVRAAASQRRRGPALPSVAGLRQVLVWEAERLASLLEPLMVLQQPEACRDVRRAAVHRGVRSAAHQACCPEQASQPARVLSSVQVWSWA